ncbi:uncharacterized protein [Marmota flaviventris]|uniref:uncharacterized protein isoform X2 n=1 Tax=Marmota flaviventris TaxID=93162 RepID=UPI003A8360DA
MFPQSRHPTPHQAAGQPFKFTIPESLDLIKEEFQFLQAQYHSLKLECEKLASEKTEMQRHYVMYYEMSYGLNIEMHKQYGSFSLDLKCPPQAHVFQGFIAQSLPETQRRIWTWTSSIVLDREIDSWLREDVRSTRPAIYLCSVIYLPMGDKGTQDLLKNCLARMYLKIRRENMRILGCS